ncbi:hypothetical protein [Chryseobacterium sp. KBW03]|uniref:hypothetical protein n=1 Tax=Chryseobacterium sp. KBW03 TaxID=2153362 RepID=UPI000F5A8F37|nr:hypothetical protein [Chryseobacterium sp. KBW03]
METIIYYFEKLYNTIKSNGIYIFLSVFFVFLLFVISDVSDDFIYALSDKGNFASVFFICLSFILLTLALWVIPASFLKIFLGSETPHQEVLSYYQGFEDIYNGKRNEKRNQIPVKYIAIAPWVIYTITLTVCLMKSLFIIESVWYIFLYLFLFSMYILNLLNRKYNILHKFFTRNKTRKRLLNTLILAAIVIAVLPLVIFLFAYPELSNKCSTNPVCVKKYYNIFLSLLAIYNVFCIVSTFLFLVYKEKESATTEQKYKFSKTLHRSTIFLSVSLLLIFCLFSLNSKLIWISPTVILIIVSTVFILAFELLYTTPRMIVVIDRYKNSSPTGKYDRQRYIFYAAMMIMLVIFILLPDKNIHMIKSDAGENVYQCPTSEKIDKRMTLNGYFLQWLIHNHQFNEKENNEPIDVILISGEGGGSTAGSWLLANLLNVEAVNPQFYNNIFSISTVSGSSNGANFYFAAKTKNILPEIPKAGFADNRRYELLKEIYTTNYFSSNFLGLMFSDYFINPIASLSGAHIDRNYILQKEEKNAMLAATSMIRPDSLKSIEAYFDQNYLDLWYKEKIDKQKQINPLFFINTTMMNKGEKAIFSPVQDLDTSRVKDIVKRFANTKYGKENYIPISAAVAQSQAFPLLSTYNNVPGVDHLGDGGFYENTGTSTTLIVYKKLKSYYQNYLKKHTKRKIRFIMINFLSADQSDKKTDKSSGLLRKSMLYYTINQTYKVPFNGHAKDALSFLEKEVESSNNIFNKQEGITDTILNIRNSEEFATTRLISKKTINKMFLYGSSEKNGATLIINALKKITDERTKMISNDNNGANVSTVYIYYSDKAEKENPELIKNMRNYISNEVIIDNPKNSEKKYIFSVQGMQNVSSFDINQVRYFNRDDAEIAEKLAREIGKKGLVLEHKYFDNKNFKKAVPKGQLQIWIDKLKKPKPSKIDAKK